MVNTPRPVKDTLKMLGLNTRYRATIVPDTHSYRGMLLRAKEHLAWCETTPSLIKQLLEKRGCMQGWKPLRPEDVKELGYKDLDSLAEALDSAEVTLSKLKGLKPSFALHPPRGGFKRSTRRAYSQGGILGLNPDLPKLIEAML